jgi:hypothetical protein
MLQERKLSLNWVTLHLFVCSMKVENIHGDARASEPITLRGQTIAKVEARGLSISHLHGELAPRITPKHAGCL